MYVDPFWKCTELTYPHSEVPSSNLDMKLCILNKG